MTFSHRQEKNQRNVICVTTRPPQTATSTNIESATTVQGSRGSAPGPAGPAQTGPRTRRRTPWG